VVAVEAERLTIKGIITGTVLTNINSDPATPLTAEQYPLGKLIALDQPGSRGVRIGIPETCMIPGACAHQHERRARPLQRPIGFRKIGGNLIGRRLNSLDGNAA